MDHATGEFYSANSPATSINVGGASESGPITIGVTPLSTLDVTVDTDTVKPGGSVVFTSHFTAAPDRALTTGTSSSPAGR